MPGSTKPLVVVLGFLDTKLEEHTLVYHKLSHLGCDVIVVDLSIRASSPGGLPVVVTPEEVRAAAKRSKHDLPIESKDRSDELDIMTAGATELVLSYEKHEKLCGILGLGGSTTTAVVASVMRATKISLPKVIVSTMASGDVSTYVGDTDITIMPSIVDISGKLNDISTRILNNACAAVAGMAHEYALRPGTVSSESTPIAKSNGEAPKRIAITMFGLTTPGVNAAVARLDTFKDAMTGKPLYSPVVFHATGAGGRSMERLIDEGWFDGVLDMTTTELADELVGGVLSAGPSRLTAAGKAGIPQVVSLGALDMVNFGAPSSIPEIHWHKKGDRLFHEHNSSVTLMRTSRDECRTLGLQIAQKLRGAKDASRTTKVVIPLSGWSGIDVEGQKFYDKAADDALVASLKSGLEGSGIEVVEEDGSINDANVASKMVELLDRMLFPAST